jgi:hypothetical protein
MLGHSGGGTNSRYVHADIERIRAKLDAGSEFLQLPKDDEQADFEHDALVSIPEELDDVMDSWGQREVAFSALTQAEQETIAKAYLRNDKFRSFIRRRCAGSELGVSIEGLDATMLAACPEYGSGVC